MIARLLRYAGLAVAGLLALAVIAALIVGNRLYASLPQTRGTMDAPGLQNTAHIVRDSWGIPHIFADRDRIITTTFSHYYYS